ncbi:LacI family DNA-binding transcriptional regulator [Herbaspirillum autotrophicum]|uniref:LacI family DNA-binding transcriptional regulator n=1 Tax=Herbaspirillum autotrophicum TaxID=180195 RepID=UPI00067C7E66|nr:LacI family DNA-binding transcriptional regulator [Herbaspirillum autotrophicum]
MSVIIKDVAKLASVSISTVSRVLCGGSVSDSVRKKVEAAIAASGYRPNLSARRLRTQHTYAIGLIVPDIRNPFFAEVGRAVEDAAYRAGLRVILCNTDGDADKEDAYLRLMEEERVTGVIMAAGMQAAAGLQQRDTPFPLLLLDVGGPVLRHDAVMLDNAQAAAMLVDHLHQKGCRRIAGLFGVGGTTTAERHAGFVAAMMAHGLPLENAHLIADAELAGQAIVQLLESVPAPQALVAGDAGLMLIAYKVLRRLGLSERIAIVGFENAAWTEVAGAGLTVIEQPLDEIGRTAVNLLLDRLAQPQQAARKLVLSGKLIVRGGAADGVAAFSPDA